MNCNTMTFGLKEVDFFKVKVVWIQRKLEILRLIDNFFPSMKYRDCPYWRLFWFSFTIIRRSWIEVAPWNTNSYVSNIIEKKWYRSHQEDLQIKINASSIKKNMIILHICAYIWRISTMIGNFKPSIKNMRGPFKRDLFHKYPLHF